MPRIGIFNDHVYTILTAFSYYCSYDDGNWSVSLQSWIRVCVCVCVCVYEANRPEKGAKIIFGLFL